MKASLLQKQKIRHRNGLRFVQYGKGKVLLIRVLCGMTMAVYMSYMPMQKAESGLTANLVSLSLMRIHSKAKATMFLFLTERKHNQLLKDRNFINAETCIIFLHLQAVLKKDGRQRFAVKR